MHSDISMIYEDPFHSILSIDCKIILFISPFNFRLLFLVCAFGTGGIHPL